MDAKELRIGNYGQEITHSTNRVVRVGKRHFEDIVRGEIDLFPIPLTEEWHNKFGVKINGFKIFEYSLPRKNNLDIKVIFNGDYVMLRQGKGDVNDDILSIWNKDLTNRDMFIHEWQNLYFTLTNEELKLK